MGEQQAMAYVPAGKCPHPEAAGKRWGDPITEERQAELQGYLDRWDGEANHNGKAGPLDSRWVEHPAELERLKLTGADVFWLARQSGPFVEDILGTGIYANFDVPNLHLEGAFLIGAHLEGCSLRLAHLSDSFLLASCLDKANLAGANLKHADLFGATLMGTKFGVANLEGADLRRTVIDSETEFDGSLFDADTKLGDIQWNGVGIVNLTNITWENVPRIGDEKGVRLRSPADGHAAVVRTYRQLAAQLHVQGMNEVADRFLHRAQIRQRWAHLSNLLVHDWKRPWRWPGDLARYLGSLFLAVLAGYGYRPGRTLFWYVATVLSFMGGYLLVTHGIPLFTLTEPSGTHPLQWYEALVLSVASFHGRGFFPQGISLGDPVAILAAAEAVMGLFIEISFIATFTQRYFGSR